MEPEDQNLTIDIPKGIPLDTDESKKISDVLDRTNKNLSMKGKVEEKKPELTEYQAPNLDALNQAIGGDMSALKTGLFKSSLINQAIKNQSEQRQAELENRAYDKFSSDQRNLISQANAQLKPFNEFKPPKESMGQVAGFQAAMMLFAGLIGGKGALGGMAALNAAGGMMKGYADGQKEVFEKAKQEFEEKMRVVQANNSRVMEILRNNMELAKTDLQVATNKAKNDFIINGQPTIADAISKAGLPAFTQFYGNALKDMNDGLKVIDSLGGGTGKLTPVMVGDRTMYLTAQQIKTYQDSGIEVKPASGRSAVTSSLMQGRADNIRDGFAQVVKDLNNYVNIPSDKAIIGTFAGMAGESGSGLISSLETTLAREVTTADVRATQQILSGLEYNLAQALGTGYANSTAKYKIDQLKSQVPKAGDSAENYLIFLANVREELNTAADNFSTKPGATPAINDAVQKYNNQLNKLIPFTVKDVQDALYGTSSSKSESNANVHPEAEQALKWAKENPDDPRSKEILKRLGAE